MGISDRYKNYSVRARWTAFLIDLVLGIPHRVAYATWKFVSASRLRHPPGQAVPAPRSILLIRPDHAGDVVMATPAIRAFRKSFPEARITVVVRGGCSTVLAGNPHVDEVVECDLPWYDRDREGRPFWGPYLKLLGKLRSSSFDMAVEMRGDFRNLLLFAWMVGAKRLVGFRDLGGEFLLTTPTDYDPDRHFVNLNLDLVRASGGDPDGVEMELFPSEEERDRARELLDELSTQGPRILVHPATRLYWHLKRWSPGKFSEISDRLHVSNGASILLSGGPDEREIVDEVASRMQKPAVSLVGRTSLRDLAAVIEKVDLVITNDSAPLHFALALNTPVVGIFGPTDAGKSGSHAHTRTPNRIVSHPVDCRRPCFLSDCPIGHVCMEEIGTDQVLVAAKQLLQGEGS